MAKEGMKVLVIPEKIAKDSKPSRVVPLRNPHSDKGSMYLLGGGGHCVCELMRQGDTAHSSWIAGQHFIKDGLLYIATPVNPIFLLLPYLLRSSEKQQGKWLPMDQILMDSEFPYSQKLKSVLLSSYEDELNYVTESKGGSDYQVYKLNRKAVMKWISAKVCGLADCLESQGVNVDAGASVAAFKRKKNYESTPEARKRFAFGVISDYLPESLMKEAKKHLGIEDEQLDDEPAPAKKEKGTCGPAEDYSVSAPKSSTKKKPLTSLQKKLAKVDKTGMKTLTSFFKPAKPAKPAK